MGMAEGLSIKIFYIICGVLLVVLCTQWVIYNANDEIIEEPCIELFIKGENTLSGEQARFIIRNESVLEVTGLHRDKEVARTKKLSSKAWKEINELRAQIKNEEIYQATLGEATDIPGIYAYIDGKYYQCYYNVSTGKYPEPYFKMNSVHKLAYKLVQESPVKFKRLLYFANIYTKK